LTLWLVRIGVGLFAVGFVCRAAAMVFRSTGPSRRLVLLRGSFQRPEDYTQVGWRLYWLGVTLGVVGLLLAFIADRRSL